MPSGRFRGGAKDRPWRRRAARAVVTVGGNAVAPGLGTGLVKLYDGATKAYNYYQTARGIYGEASDLLGASQSWLRKNNRKGTQPTITDRYPKQSKVEKMVDQRMRSRSGSRARSVTSRRRSSRRAFAPGKYVGHFNVPKPVKPPGKYALYGYSTERDVYGEHTQNECNILGVRSLVPMEIAKAVGVAFIRQVMRKHYAQDYTDEKCLVLGGFLNQGPTDGGLTGIMTGPVDGTEERYRQTSITWTSPRYLYFYAERNGIAANVVAPDNGLSGTDFVSYAKYTFSATDTLADFSLWFARHVFLSGQFGSAANKDSLLKGYQFVEADGFNTWAATASSEVLLRPQAFVPVDRMYVKILSTTAFMVQNITAAGEGVEDVNTGQDRLADRIDANPVVGKVMKFSTSLPRIRDARRNGQIGYGVTSTVALQKDADIKADSSFCADLNSDGILKGTAPIALTELRSTPRADYFRGCTGEATVSLEPGEIKKFNIVFKYDGLLFKLIQGFNDTIVSIGTTYGSTTNDLNLDDQFGTCALFFLEQRIRNGSGNVKLAFEAHRFVAARVKKVGRVTMNKSAYDQAG